MSNVIQLPDSMQRQWREMEAALRPVFQQLWDASNDEQDALCAALKPIFLKYAKPLDIAVSQGNPDEAISELQAWVFQLANGLMSEIARREMMLIRLGSGS